MKTSAQLPTSPTRMPGPEPPRRESHSPQATAPTFGRLTQLAAFMNGSPRMHSLTEMAAWMNPAAPADTPPTQLEASAAPAPGRTGQSDNLNSINNDPALEHEADVMGRNALQMTRGDQVETRSTSVQREVIQREGGGVLGSGALLSPGGVGGADRFLLAEPEQQEEEGRARDFSDWSGQLQELQQQHVLNQRAVYAIIDAPADLENLVQIPDIALPVETILINTREFIRQRLAVIPMTPTLTARLKPPREFERFWPPVPDEARKGELFFDDNTGYPATGSNKKAAEGLRTTDAGVIVRDSHETAHADGISIRVFMDQPLNPEALKSVLIHEIQHVVDRHGGDFREAVLNDINGKAGDVGNAYRTEFRAYWLGDRGHGGFGDPAQAALNNRNVVEKWWLFNWRAQPTAFANVRQENIFWHLATSGSYPWVKPNYLQSAPFRNLVNGLTNPTGGNLINSIRIDGFRATLGLAAPGFNYYVDDVLDDAQALDALDLFYLHTPKAAQFWTFFDTKFNGPFDNVEHRDRVALIKQQLEEIIGRR